MNGTPEGTGGAGKLQPKGKEKLIMGYTFQLSTNCWFGSLGCMCTNQTTTYQAMCENTSGHVSK